MPVIPASREAGDKRIEVEVSPGKSGKPFLKNKLKRQKRTRA
jgi:hypothetical protein